MFAVLFEDSGRADLWALAPGAPELVTASSIFSPISSNGWRWRRQPVLICVYESRCADSLGLEVITCVFPASLRLASADSGASVSLLSASLLIYSFSSKDGNNYLQSDIMEQQWRLTSVAKAPYIWGLTCQELISHWRISCFPSSQAPARTAKSPPISFEVPGLISPRALVCQPGCPSPYGAADRNPIEELKAPCSSTAKITGILTCSLKRISHSRCLVRRPGRIFLLALACLHDYITIVLWWIRLVSLGFFFSWCWIWHI